MFEHYFAFFYIDDDGIVHGNERQFSMQQTIALVDDDRNILTSLSMFLEEEGYRVRTYRDGQEARNGIYRQPPDLALLDIKLPRMGGLELLEKIQETRSTPVIFLTSKDDETDEIIGLRLGADDYIKKPFSQRLVLERIKAVLRRHCTLEIDEIPDREKIIIRGELILDPLRHSCCWKGIPVRLTVTEFLILKALAKNSGHVKSRDQLMDSAYGGDIFVLDRNIDSHVKRLRKKIRASDIGFDEIETLYGLGYRYRNRLN